MSHLARAMTLLLAVNFETVILFLAVFYGGEWLNKNHPTSFNWYWVVSVVGGAATLFSWIVFFKVIFNAQKE